MKKASLAVLAAVVLALSFAPAAQAATLSQALSGRILLAVESRGEAWYVYPPTGERYYLGQASDAYAIMRKLGVGISELNFQKIAQAGTSASGNLTLARTLAGKIILQVEKHGEAWYINPVNLKKYYLGRAEDAYAIMRQLGLGIKNVDLAKIPRAQKDDAANSSSNYKYYRQISTSRGSFYYDVAEIALSQLGMKIISDTAGVEKCSTNCPVKALYDYVANQKAFAAAAGYSATSPFYNSLSKRMMNGTASGPLIAFDENNKFYYFASTAEFGSPSGFESVRGVKLSAAFGGGPRLIENGANVLKTSSLSSAQLSKTWRSAFVYKKQGLNPQGTAYLIYVRSASLTDLASVAMALGADYAVAMGSGGQASLYYNTDYKVNLGVAVPNAVLFVKK
jgi:hypothetical protein